MMWKLATLLTMFTVAQTPATGLDSSFMDALKTALSPNAPKALTTTVRDTGRQLPQLDDFSPANQGSLTWLPRASDGSFELRAGAFDWTVLGYCLDVTAHGPSGDAAYLPATIRGPRAALVETILKRAAASPTMKQEDAQTLVWTVTTNFAKMASLLRTEFGGPASYQQQARIVETPVKAKNVAFPPSRWVYRAPGYFERVHVQSYKIAGVQVYVPEGWRLHRDGSGRISSVGAPNGSSVTLTYRGSGATVGVKEWRASVDRGYVASGSSTIAYTGNDRDDATALRELEDAIRRSPPGSPSWASAMRARAADDVARTRAELVCRTVACGAGNAGTKPAFALDRTMAVPADAAFQPVALTTRGGDAGAGPLTPGPPPCDHTGSPNDPIPVECLPKAPPDPKADCPEIALQLAVQRLFDRLFMDAKIVAGAVAIDENGGQYAGRVGDAFSAAVGNGALAPELAAAGLNAPATPPINGAGSASAGDVDRTGALASTSMISCVPAYYVLPSEVPPILYSAILAHEAEHIKTCQSRPVEKRPAMDTPAAHSADEQRAFAISIAMLQKWYNAHCK